MKGSPFIRWKPGNQISDISCCFKGYFTRYLNLGNSIIFKGFSWISSSFVPAGDRKSAGHWKQRLQGGESGEGFPGCFRPSF